MDILNIDKKESYLEQIIELFKETTTDDFYYKWADTFEIVEISDKKVYISYHGPESFKKFKKECRGALFACIYSIVGTEKKVVMTVNKKKIKERGKARKNIKAANFFVVGMVFVCIAMAISVVMYSYIGNRNFRETFYVTSSIKVDSPVRVIQISDLHGISYGTNNDKLLERVSALKPDIIICTGDIVNSAKDEEAFAVQLGKGLAEIAPAYYIYGNNEIESIYGFSLSEEELDKKFGFDEKSRDESALGKIEDAFEKKLEEAGIKVLKNEKDTIQVKSMTVDVYGVLTSNPSSFWSYSAKAFSDYIDSGKENLKIMAVHEPFIFQEFEPESWGDLMVCGHTHGGIMRIPVLGPLYTHEGGLLPERGGNFVYGKYQTSGSPLVVSGGMENADIFRVNNEPELVVIDINKF